MLLAIVQALIWKSNFRKGMDQWAEGVQLEHRKKKTDSTVATENRRHEAQKRYIEALEKTAMAGAQHSAPSRKTARIRQKIAVIQAEADLLAAKAGLLQIKRDIREASRGKKNAPTAAPEAEEAMGSNDDRLFDPD